MTWTHVSHFQLVRFLHSRFFQVAVPAMGISRRLKKSRRSGRFSNVHLFLLTVASAMKCQVQTVESGQYSYVASIFKIFFPSAIPFWNFLAARCYVDESNTCGDAKSSSFGAPFSWSCQACQSLAKKGESLTSEREQMHEGVELSCGFKLFLIKLIKNWQNGILP